jgi:hypothetical protein
VDRDAAVLSTIWKLTPEGWTGRCRGPGENLIMERRPSRTEAGPAQSVAWAGEPGPKGRSPRRYVIPMCDAYLL